MNITCAITDGMNAAEKEAYFQHMEKVHAYAADKVNAERDSLKSYKWQLINGIIEMAGERFTVDDLMKKSIRTLERIYDYC